MNGRQGGIMPDSEVTLVLKKASAEVGAARRDLKMLCAKWAEINSTAKDVARFELCTALVRRLEIAEEEIRELIEFVE